MEDDETLGAAREWLRHRVDEGAICPCCTQFAKVYRRRIHHTMARDLVILHQAVGSEWSHVADVIAQNGRTFGGDFGKLTYWGLTEELQEKREDGGRAGWWRITPLGHRFVLREVRVPKYARVYDGRCLSLTGEPVSITDALGDKFDYDELMNN